MGAKVSSPLWVPCPFEHYTPQILLTEIEKVHTKSATISGNRKIRIVICACGKDGKSSSINNVLAALSDQYDIVANSGGQNVHVTQRYQEFDMHITNQNDCPYVICDTPGLRPYESLNRQMVQTEAIKAAITGKFEDEDEMDFDVLKLEDLKQMEEKQGRAVCVIFVIDSSNTSLKGHAFKCMESILAFVQQQGIKTACLLTKCDLLDTNVKEDITKIYYSKKVERARQKVEEDFNFPGDRIFPIVNYTNLLNTTPKMRIQTLVPLMHMMRDVLSSFSRKVKVPTTNQQ